MTPPVPPRAAVARGFPAFVLATMVDRHGPAAMVELQRGVERGTVDPRLVAQVLPVWAEIRAAAQEWAHRHRTAVDGSAEVDSAEVASESVEISTAAAADVLAVSPRRVRQLVADGAIAARKVGRVWLVDAASVRLHQATMESDFERVR